ncbi:MAG: hypothetical protein AAGI08_00125 [Bacteroidota bacterium]
MKGVNTETEHKGWAGVVGGRKYHYFVDMRSLCGRYMFFGPSENLDDSKHQHSENCATCKRKRNKLFGDDESA